MLADRVAIWEEELRQEGEARFLLRFALRLSRTRFGELPDFIEARLKSGTREQLELWCTRLLGRGSLDDLFRDEISS